jgi:hypothetical protein
MPSGKEPILEILCELAFIHMVERGLTPMQDAQSVMKICSVGFVRGNAEVNG